MHIKINPDALRTALQAIRAMYPSDIEVFYSVEANKLNIESVGGSHRFLIQFDVEADVDLPMQKTTAGTLTQLPTLLGEYPDIQLSDAAITWLEGKSAHALTVKKLLVESAENLVDCLTLTRTMLVTVLSDGEKESVLKSRANYTGELLFECPAAVTVAAQKAHILKADGLYLRGKTVYSSSGDGICRVRVPEMDDNLNQKLDAEFTYNLTKLGADKYNFFENHVECKIGEVDFKLGIPKKAIDREIAQEVIDLFDSIEANDVRVYGKEVRSIHGAGPLKIQPNKTMLLDNKITVTAPYILPLKENILQVGDEHSVKQQSVTISQIVAQAAGDEWTVGLGIARGKVVAKVSGDCDILFNAYS